MIDKLSLQNFTVFEELDLNFSPGVNILIGENGTGKTHLLKLLYAFLSTGEHQRFAVDIQEIFKVSYKDLVRRTRKSSVSHSEIRLGLSDEKTVVASLNKGGLTDSLLTNTWDVSSEQVVYIPVKEILAHAPGFKSLVDRFHMDFDKVYPDIIGAALVPPVKKDLLDPAVQPLLKKLGKAMNGTVEISEERFFLVEKNHGRIDFHMVAEGLRKIGLLWKLLENGTLGPGSVLFWDEPEANLNPKLMEVVVEILLAMERFGVQIFIASHSFALLKFFDLLREDHALTYHSLFKNDEGAVQVNSSPEWLAVAPNPIGEAFDRIYDLDVMRKFGAGK